jgi:hypothetical protein
MANKNHTTVFPVVTTIQIGTRAYRTGICFGGMFVKEVESGAYLHFYSQRSRDYFLLMLRRAAGETDPDPTPTPAASIRLIETSVAAQDSHMTDNIIKIKPAKKPSEAQARLLKNLIDEGGTSDVGTPAEAWATPRSVVKHGWMTTNRNGEIWTITEAGRAAYRLVSEYGQMMDDELNAEIRYLKTEIEVCEDLLKTDVVTVHASSWHIYSEARVDLPVLKKSLEMAETEAELRDNNDYPDLPQFRQLIADLKPAASKTSPADAQVRDNVIRIPDAPTKVVGAYYPDSFSLADLCVSFLDQYGAMPTRIAFNDADDTYRFAEFAGIPVVKSRTVPSRQIHLMFDPAKAEAVCNG